MFTRVELHIAVGAGCRQAELSLPLRQAQGNRKLLAGKLEACPERKPALSLSKGRRGTPERLTLTAAVEGLRALTRSLRHSPLRGSQGRLCDVRLRARRAAIPTTTLTAGTR